MKKTLQDDKIIIELLIVHFVLYISRSIVTADGGGVKTNERGMTYFFRAIVILYRCSLISVV